MTAYYNENDPKAAAWLCELIKQGHIAPGVVDTRSIEDVRPVELAGFTQCHFFAGIGGWSLALRLAGWPDDRPVWTGSCPCQPFSAAGKRTGTSDDRHLWPHFHWLIKQCRPVTVFGEQVASKDGLDWLDIVQADLENSDYTSGAVDLCAAGFGAPHIRQRLFWVAQSAGDRRSRERQAGSIEARPDAGRQFERQRADQRGEFSAGFERSGFELLGGMADTNDSGSQRRERVPERTDQCIIGSDGLDGGMANASSNARNERHELESDRREINSEQDGLGGELSNPNPTNGFWGAVDWLGCRDGKWRPVEPKLKPLVNGTSNRLGKLRGYGNAINAEAAKAFTQAAGKEAINQAVDDFNDNFNSALRLGGVSVTALQTQLQDPKSAWEICVVEACASRGVSLTELIGFMTGERASTQNSSAFTKRLKKWQKKYSNDIHSFLQWLIDLELLPQPSNGEFKVCWPDIGESSKSEKLENAGKMTAQNEQAFKAGQEPPWSMEEIRQEGGAEAEKPESEYNDVDLKEDLKLDDDEENTPD